MDEALITEEERREELAALHDEVDLPLEEILKRYRNNGNFCCFSWSSCLDN